MKRLILLLALALLIFAGILGIATAETKENIYSNKFVGLSFPVPEGWYLATDKETMELMPEGARVMGLDDPAAKATVAQIPGKVLLMTSEHPLSSDVQSFNRNIILLAINVREVKDEIRSGADYLAQISSGMGETQPSSAVSDIITHRLGGEEFHRLNVGLPMQDITVQMCQLARVHNDYLVIFNMSAESEMSLTELVQIADNVRLSAVSDEVDDSPEGQSFRKQSSIDLSGSSGGSSSGGNLLKNLGIIFIILGAIWFIKNLFGIK